MKLSICCITYNQEKYIGQSLEGMLSQKTNFDFEIVIGEDFSSDGTLRILNSYKERYPNKIKLIVNEMNLGIMANLINTLKMCKGKYIAFCEGDDYWTDENKLQKQVDFLDSNEEYSICFHAINELDEKGNLSEPSINNFDRNITYSIENIAEYNIIHSPSVMWKGSVIELLPKWILQAPLGDFILHLLYASRGKVYFMKETMAVYRKHSAGVWSLIAPYKNMLKLKWVVDNMDRYFDYKYHKSFYSKRFLEDYYLSLLNYYKEQRQSAKYFYYLFHFALKRRTVNRTRGNIFLLAKQFYQYKKV